MEYDLVKEFADILCKYCDCRREYAEAAGYALISATLGMFFRCPWVPKDSSRPNLFIVLSSDPGLFRRSNVQSAVERIIKIALHDYVMELLGQVDANKDKCEDEISMLSEDYINDKVMLYGSGSPEGVCDHIASAVPAKMFHIHSTEFGGTIANMFGEGKSYNEGLSVLYSMLYYGEGGTIPLSTRGKGNVKRKVPEGLYTTLFVGMQEIGQYLHNSKAIKLGFFRRILIIYFGKNDDPGKYQPYIREDKQEMYKELDAYAERLHVIVNKVREYTKTNNNRGFEEIIKIQPSTTILDKINKYDKEVNDVVRKNRTDTNLAKQSYPEILTKLTLIRQIGMNNINTEAKEIICTVCNEAFALSEKFLKEVGSNVDEALENIGVKEIAIQSTQSMDDKVFNFIARYPDGVTQGEMTSKTRWEANRNDNNGTTDVIARLINIGKIRTEKIPTGGRSSQKYWVVS